MKRPRILTLICIIGYLSVVFSFPQVFSPQVKKLGTLMPALYGLLVAASFIACVGIWYLKRWGVELYWIAFFSKILFALAVSQLGGGFMVSTALSLTFGLLLLRYYKRMDANL